MASLDKLGLRCAGVLVGVSLCLLAGCSRRDSLAEVCQASPAICQDLDLDSTCREARTPLVALRVALSKQPELLQQDETQFKQLQLVEAYNRCLKRASGIQHVNNPYLTNNAQRAYALTSLTLAQILEQTEGSTNPHLAYYHWVHLGDRQALRVLLAAQRNGQIKEAYILAGLATSQLDDEPDTARMLFLEALRNASAREFVADWLLALAKVTPDREIKYLLQKTNIDLTERKADQRMLSAQLAASAEVQAQLDLQALILAKAFTSGSYSSSRWPDFLAGNKQVMASIIAAEG